ncbi:MAG TPA: hypothetical protein VFS77_09405, partial [Pyrinomonadaceae bacterium]|nr:hypothetical protein [Pyrinomonadaceae bacterium]
MKKIMTVLTIGAAVAMLALPVSAMNLSAETQDAACAQEAKDALYKTFVDNRQNDQPKAFDAAKKYLACPEGTPNEAQQKILDYLKRWTKAYEEGKRKNDLDDALYNKKDYDLAFKLGREILATEPEYVKGLVDLGANGYLVVKLKNDQVTGEALQYARKALQLLESGKTLENWGPLQNKDVAVAYLNYTIGSLTVEKEPAAALKHLLKSAQFETPLKKSAVTYALIAGAYETGPYATQSQEYKDKYLNKDETPESKLALANINQLVDRMIDAYARAVALAGTDANLAAQKTAWNESLMQWYKFRNNNSDTGMTEFVAGILSKPLPPEPTPITVLPSTPASTPAGTSGATPNNGNGTGNGAATT